MALPARLRLIEPSSFASKSLPSFEAASVLPSRARGPSATPSRSGTGCAHGCSCAGPSGATFAIGNEGATGGGWGCAAGFRGGVADGCDKHCGSGGACGIAGGSEDAAGTVGTDMDAGVGINAGVGTDAGVGSSVSVGEVSWDGCTGADVGCGAALGGSRGGWGITGAVAAVCCSDTASDGSGAVIGASEGPTGCASGAIASAATTAGCGDAAEFTAAGAGSGDGGGGAANGGAAGSFSTGCTCCAAVCKIARAKPSWPGAVDGGTAAPDCPTGEQLKY